MADIGLSKTIYDRENGFVRVGLSGQEQADALKAVRDAHVRIMRECFEDAQLVLARTAPSNLVRIACALFERRAPATYTVLQEVLGRKVYALKNGNGGDKHE